MDEHMVWQNVDEMTAAAPFRCSYLDGFLACRFFPTVCGLLSYLVIDLSFRLLAQINSTI